jgi:gluconolactonase
MIFKQNKSKKLTFIAIICSSLLIASCMNNTTTQVKISNNINSSGALEVIAKSNELYCPQGSENIQLSLKNIKLTRAQNIPLMYQGYNNIEGPVWYDGALYYSNMGSHQSDKNGFILSNQTTIWRWIPGKQPQVWMKDSAAGTNGLALDNQSNLVVTRQLDGSLSTIDWKTKQVTPIVSAFQSKRFNSPNDLTITYDNNVYFTDPNWNTPSNINVAETQGGGQPGSVESGQRIYHVDFNGKVNATKVTELVPALGDKPNGIILSLDQQQLIVGGLQGLWVFDLKSGEVSNPQQLLDTPIDGLGKDCSGNIYVTTTRVMPERKDGQIVVVLNKKYKEVGVLPVEGIQIVTNIAFGGNDGKTLFVTTLTAPMDGDKRRLCGDTPCLKASIYTTKLNVQGFPF